VVADINAPIRAYAFMVVIMPVVMVVFMPFFMVVVMAVMVVVMPILMVVVVMAMPVAMVMFMAVASMPVAMVVAVMVMPVAVMFAPGPVFFACIAHAKYPPLVGTKEYRQTSKITPEAYQKIGLG
jgi:hypothetical protein